VRKRGQKPVAVSVAAAEAARVGTSRRANRRFAVPGAFVVEGAYFGRKNFEGVEQRDGLRMYFAGWS
jgi:hypothetical protein